jgi:hypothetical protein
METSARLDLEKEKLVPAWRDGLGGNRLGLHLPILSHTCGVELQSTTPLLLPHRIMWKRHVKNVGNASCANHVVMIEEVTAFCV